MYIHVNLKAKLRKDFSKDTCSSISLAKTQDFAAEAIEEIADVLELDRICPTWSR